MAGATVEETACENVNMWQAPVSQKPPKKGPRMWQGQVWEARPDREQRVARQSLERGMEAASGKKRTPQHEGVTEGRGGNGRKPLPHTMCQTPNGRYVNQNARFPDLALRRRRCLGW